MTQQYSLSKEALDAVARELKQHRSKEEYAKSVVVLLKLALGDTSGSRAAAQVLLSGYNGGNWQLNITDLCHLDRDHLHHALIVMECRATLWAEPNDLVKNGNELFMKLQEQWKKLHVKNRWKPVCQECGGTGEVYKNPDDEMDYTLIRCEDCNGEGLVSEVSEF